MSVVGVLVRLLVRVAGSGVVRRGGARLWSRVDTPANELRVAQVVQRLWSAKVVGS